MAIWYIITRINPIPYIKSVHELPYNGKLSREKTFMDLIRVITSQRKLSLNAKTYHRWVYMARPNLEEKTFPGGSKTAKFMNIFSLESFPLLYCTVCISVRTMNFCSHNNYVIDYTNMIKCTIMYKYQFLARTQRWGI